MWDALNAVEFYFYLKVFDILEIHVFNLLPRV